MGEATSFDIITLGGPEPSRKRARGTRVCRSHFTDEQVAEVRRMWGESSRAEIAAYLGISVGSLQEHSSYGIFRDLPRRQGRGGGRPVGFRVGDDDMGPGYRDPSPKEIEMRAAEIRSRWTLEDAQVRCNRMAPPEAPMWDHARLSGIRIIPTSAFQTR
jgi:hypothetical protein